jgi:hypothetical protein
MVSSVVVRHVVESANVRGLTGGDDLGDGLLERSESVGGGLRLVDDLRDRTEVKLEKEKIMRRGKRGGRGGTNHAKRHVTGGREARTVLQKRRDCEHPSCTIEGE